MSVFLNGCEKIYENVELNERVYSQFLKHILNSKSCSPSFI